MRRGTTPTLNMEVKDINLTGMYLELAISTEEEKVFTKAGKDLTLTYEDPDTLVDVTLTQEETLALTAEEYVYLQIRFIDSADVADATDIVMVPVTGILRDGVIKYEL